MVAGDHPRGTIVSRLSTRGFFWHPGITVIGATIAGLALMNITFIFGLPIIFGMVGLFAGILLVLGFGGGDMEYVLTRSGIVRTFKPFAARYVRVSTRRQIIAFDDVRSYRRDRDLGRDKGEYAFLRLKLRKRPYRVTINDKSGGEAFNTFADAFEALAGHRPVDPEAGDVTGRAARSRPPPTPSRSIRREKGFYDTFFAKGLTIFFAGVAVALSVFQFTGELSGTNLFRLNVIIVPGVIYMAYRCFGPRRDPRRGPRRGPRGNA